jgi:hypothetical protein
MIKSIFKKYQIKVKKETTSKQSWNRKKTRINGD